WALPVCETVINIGCAAGGSDVDSADLTGANEGDGTTGAKPVDTGTYFFSEASAGLGNYDTSFACTGAAASPSKISDYSYSLAVAKNETAVCTFTNTRQQGSVELKKDWVGTVGETVINIGSTDGGSDVGTKDVAGASWSDG